MSKDQLPELPDLDALNTTKLMARPVHLELHHPSRRSQKLGIFIPLVGKDSPAFRDYLRDKVNDNLRREYENRQRGRDAGAPTLEKAEEDLIESLLVCVMAANDTWYTEIVDKDDPEPDAAKKRKIRVDKIRMGSETLDFNHANVRRVLVEQLWVRTQLDSGVGDLEVFIENSSKT